MVDRDSFTTTWQKTCFTGVGNLEGEKVGAKIAVNVHNLLVCESENMLC